MPRLTICILLLFFTCTSTLTGQQTSQIFTVVSISENAGIEPGQLNASLASAKTMDDARNIIRNGKFKNAIIKLYISIPGSPKKYWKIDTKEDMQSSDNFRVLRSKGTERVNITRLNDFREQLPDTLLLLEDILFTISLNEEGYKDAWFTVHQFCNDKENTIPATKNKEGKLVLSPSISNCEPYTTIDICNDYNPKRRLRHFVVTTLQGRDNKILEKIAQDFLHDNQGTNSATITDFMDAVMTTYYGHPLHSALNNWMRLHVSNMPE